jgi:hypothetical protein
MSKRVTNNDIALLQARGLLTKEETAIIVGDQVIAENVITKERRVINVGGLLLESKKVLLKG